jgi:hypothetical protein
MPATSLSTYALTTLASVKRHLRITSTADDTLLTECINSATDRIEHYCCRQFAEREYRVREEMTGNRRTFLHYPITHIYRVAWGWANAIGVNYTGSGVRASVSVTETAVDLRSVGSTGTVTDTALTFAVYGTTALMAAAITAISGWSATAIVNTASTDLNTCPGLSALGRTAYLTYPDIDSPNYVVDRATGCFWWRAIPLDSQQGWYSYSEVDSLGYETDPLGYNRDPLDTQRLRNVLIEYKAGYATIPDDLGGICNDLVLELYNQGKRNPNLKSESLGDYSYTLANGTDISEALKARLAFWRRIPAGQATP